jgi:hypothetical protein
MSIETEKIHIFDNFLDKNTHEELYHWIQDKSFYAFNEVLPKLWGVGVAEYCPNKDGKYPTQKGTKSALDISAMSKVIRTGLPRFPIATGQEDLDKNHFPIINKIWNKINQNVFKNNASVDGIPEDQLFPKPNNFFIDNKKPHDKWPHINEGDCFYTVFVNGRCSETIWNPTISVIKDGNLVSGRGHRDSNCREFDQNKNNYLTVLYCANLEWNPLWGGDIGTWADSPNNEFKTTSDHQAFNYGRIDNVIAHVPNRLIIFSHAKTHGPITPIVGFAPERNFRLAFRVKILEGEFTSNYYQ